MLFWLSRQLCACRGFYILMCVEATDNHLIVEDQFQFFILFFKIIRYL